MKWFTLICLFLFAPFTHADTSALLEQAAKAQKAVTEAQEVATKAQAVMEQVSTAAETTASTAAEAMKTAESTAADAPKTDEDLVEKNQAEGLTQDAIDEDIINNSNDTKNSAPQPEAATAQ